jgi:hypothetical protein
MFIGITRKGKVVFERKKTDIVQYLSVRKRSCFTLEAIEIYLREAESDLCG